MIIYKIQNKINNKIYIGQTVRTLEERIKEHKRNKNCVMYKAFKKYGFENFDIKQIDEAKTIEELNEKEIYYINLYDSKNNGYNMCDGGGNTKGYKHTEKSKKKMSQNHGKYYKEKNSFYGKHHSEETKEKMRKKWHEDKEKYNRRVEQLKLVRHKSDRKIECITTGDKFNSIKEACQKYNIKDGTHISRVCRGKRKSCFGLVFKYID